MDPYLEANRRRWDEMAELHPRTEFYDLADLRAGGIHLPRLERDEVGDVGYTSWGVLCWQPDIAAWAGGERLRGARWLPLPCRVPSIPLDPG